ncbi:YebC/PmpR family DNA-binding transcriptional regulator [Candidatus Gracilibacteria bacterium]|nr:YebC/PmpR family DNA-binding transcriptional regulator [Candidatus Gracilibacteria bacterium]
MGRGPVVQARKMAVNSEKGKVFSIHAKLIALAAQKGGNPEDNANLATLIYKAKKDGVPNDTIDRAIKKGTGEDKDAAQLSEIIYEGYAPGGVALLVSCISDNKNRTVSNIRHIFSKYGGNMGESGAVAWMFEKKGIIFVDPKKHSMESIEEIIFDTNAENLELEEGYIKIVSSLDDHHSVEQFLEGKEIELLESKIDFIPSNEIEIDDFDKALKFKKMIEAFEEDEDVSFIASNELINSQLDDKVEDFIEKNTFRT